MKEGEFESSENTDQISSLVSFHQYFQVCHTKFNVRFRHLLLLEMIFLEEIFKTVGQKFALQCK